MSTKLGKKSEIPIFKQILDLIPNGLLRKSIAKYNSDKNCSKYFSKDELISLFGQLNGYLTLREIAFGIDQSPEFLGDIGLAQSPAKSTMSDGNAKRVIVCLRSFIIFCAHIIKNNFDNVKITK